MEAEEGPQQEQDLHRRGDRRAQERCRRQVRARQAVREAHKGGPAPAHRRGLGDLPRHGEVPQVAGRGGAGHRPALQGRHQGPGVP